MIACYIAEEGNYIGHKVEFHCYTYTLAFNNHQL